MFVGEMIDDLNIVSNGKDIIEKIIDNDLMHLSKDILVINEETFSITSVSNIDNKNDEVKYITRLELSKLKAKLNQLKYLEGFGIDTDENNLLEKEENQSKEMNVTIFEALMDDYLNLDEFVIENRETGDLLSIDKAVEKELINIKTAENLFNCLETLSFEELIKKEIYDIENNSFGEFQSLDKAIESEIVVPELTYLSYPGENKFTNLKKLIESGILNPFNNEIKMENSNKELIVMKLNDAIDPLNGIFSTNINAQDKIKQLPNKLDKLMKDKSLDPEITNINFKELGINILSVNDALKKGLINGDSMVKIILDKLEDGLQEIEYCDDLEEVNLINKLNKLTEILDEQLLKINDDNKESFKMTELFKQSIKDSLMNDINILEQVEKYLIEKDDNLNNDHVILKEKRIEVVDKLNQVKEITQNQNLNNWLKLLNGRENENMFKDVEISNVIQCNSLSGKMDNKTIIIGARKPDSNEILSVEEALKEEIIDIENQTYKYDPEKNDKISWIDAIQEELLICCEVNQAMLTPDFLKCLILSRTDEYLNIDEIELIGILDTTNNKMKELDEAIKEKLFDLNSCLFYDKLHNKWLTLKDAIAHGFILAKYKDIECEIHRVNVEFVKLGNDQRKVSLEIAIKESCIDQLTNTYSIKEPNLELSLIDAIMCGLIKIIASPDINKVDVNSLLSLQRKPEDPEIKDLCSYTMNSPINLKLLSKAQESDCLEEFLIYDDIKESICKSIYLDHLILDPLLCGIEEKKSILLGCIKGELNLENLERFLDNVKDMFVGEMIDDLNIVSNGKDIIEKIIDSDLMHLGKDLLVINEETFSITSVSNIDNKNDEVKYITRLELEKMKAKLNQLKYLEGFGIDTNENNLLKKEENQTKEMNISVFEAVMTDYLNLDEFVIEDNKTNEPCSIIDGVEKGLLNVKTAENILNCLESLSFEELIKNELYDSDKNSFGELKALDKSIAQKIISPELVFLSSNDGFKFVNLKALIDCGTLNPFDNIIRMEMSNKELLNTYLSNAIDPSIGMFSAVINCQKLKNHLPRKLKYILNENLINPENTNIIYDKNEIPKMTLMNALKSRMVTYGSIVKIIAQSSKDKFSEIKFMDNFEIINLIFELNNLFNEVMSLKLKDNSSIVFDGNFIENQEFVCEELLTKEEFLNENIDAFLTSIDSNKMKFNLEQLDYIKDTRVEIRDLLKEFIDSTLICNSNNTADPGAILIDSLKEYINKTKLKLNTMNRHLKKLDKYSNNNNDSKSCLQNEIIETSTILKSYQTDLFMMHEEFLEFKDKYLGIESLINLSSKTILLSQSNDLAKEMSELETFLSDINSENTTLLTYLDDLLNTFSYIEQSLENLRFDFNELEITYNEENKSLKLTVEQLDLQLQELSKCKNDAHTLKGAFVKLINEIENDFNEMGLFVPMLLDLKDYSLKCADLITKLDNRKNTVMQIKERFSELLKTSDAFNESLEKINNKLGSVKSQDKTDETLCDIISIRKSFTKTIDEYEQIKNACESYINNPIFQNKERIINILGNIVARQKELYLRINEELINQVESKLSLLLIELGKLQIFIMDLPKNWDTNIKDIKERIDEIKSYIENLHTMEKDLQAMDKVLSEDLNDQLEIDFELLEKGIMNIQYCEKERLSTQTDLDKIYNIICNNYLPTIITYEDNKEIAENLINATNKNLEDFIKDFNLNTISEKEKHSPYLNEIINDRKINLQKIENTLFEIEPIVESVESYGFDLIEQLIELTSDYGSDCSVLQSIKDDIQNIRQKFKVLKDRLNEMDTEIVDFLSPNSKSISDKLASEYESWRSFNDVLSRLEPIQSMPEKLNKQFEEISSLWDQIKKKESLFQPFKQTINKIISDSDNDLENQDDIKESLDNIQTENDNFQSEEIQEIKDSLKEIENLLDSVFYKVEHRMTIIKELKDVVNNFWPEISDINKSVINIQKEATALEAFPNNKQSKTSKIRKGSSIQSDSLSLLTEPDNKSTISSIDFELEDKINEDFEMDLPLANIINEESDFVNEELVHKQYAILKKIGLKLKNCTEKIEVELQPKAQLIIKIGGQSCELEVNEFIDSVYEEIGTTEDVLEEKEIIIDKALHFVNFLSEEIKKLLDWFPIVENRLHNIGNVSPDQKMIQLNLMELKALNTEIFSKSINLDKITSAINEITSYPYVPNKKMLEDLKVNIKEKYSELIKNIMEKHNDLQLKYNDIGELDFALEDNIGILQEFENQMKNLTRQSCKGDPEYTYSCLKNLRVLTNAFNGLQSIIKNLSDKVGTYGDLDNKSNFRYRGTLSIFGKMKEINDLCHQINLIIPEKDSMIQEILKNEKLISKELHMHIEYLEKLNSYLKLTPKIGLNQESVSQSNQAYMNHIENLNKQRNAIESSIKLGNSLIENCPYEKCTFLTTALKTLSHKYKRCQQLADKRKDKLNHYSQIVLEFDKEKQILLKDILDLEILSINKMTPSKITATCAEQIKIVKMSIQKAEKCYDTFENLNIRLFEIKCFGTRLDNSQLNSELREYSVKLNKIRKCLRERIRIFNQAYREDKQFTDSYATLNAWLDESYNLIESFKNEPSKVLDHLDKLKNLCKQLSAQYANFHCTIRYGSYLKDRCIADDPEKAILFEMLKTLRIKWNKIRNLITTEKTTLNRKLIETGNIYDAIKCVNYWINDTIAKFGLNLNVYGDIDTVEVLIDECKLAEDEIRNHHRDFDNLKNRMLKEIKDYEEIDIRSTMANVEEQFAVFVFNVKKRSEELKDALIAAEEFNKHLDKLRIWLRQTEKLLKFKTLPKFQNEGELVELIEKHEVFIRNQKEIKTELNELNNVGKLILEKCHPMAKSYINRIMFTVGNKWNQMNNRGLDRSKKLNEALGTLRGSTALIEELIYKVGENLSKLQAENFNNLPNEISKINEIINKHLIFNNSLSEIDVQIKTLIDDFKLQHPVSVTKNQQKRYRDPAEFYKNRWKNSKDFLNRSSNDLTSNTRLNFLNMQFNKVWKLSIERKSNLQNHLLNLNEKEQLEKFDYNSWKLDFTNFIKVKGLRLTDLFRKQQASRLGYHRLNEFTNCILKSGFPTNKSILQEVFNIFNKNNSNEILYQDFIDSLRPERRSQIDKSINLNDKKTVTIIIHDIIEREVASCICKYRYSVKKEGDNKYGFGINNKLYMVRYLNSTVMVRIGGGWQTITEFLQKNDPCRVIEKPGSRSSITEGNKTRSSKSSPVSAAKTGTILVKAKHSLDEKSPLGVRSQQKQTTPSKIPSPNITKIPKK